jgi:uncharacterized protein DUF4437
VPRVHAAGRTVTARPQDSRRGLRLWLPLLIFALLAAGFFVFMRSLAKKEMPREASKALSAEEMNWLDLMELPGALRAVLWGDAASGAYGAWNKWPAGTDSGAFTQSADSRIVVMSGTLLYSAETGPPKDLGAGSYVFVPAGQVRSLKCAQGNDCIFFNEQPSRFDFIRVTAPK